MTCGSLRTRICAGSFAAKAAPNGSVFFLPNEMPERIAAVICEALVAR